MIYEIPERILKIAEKNGYPLKNEYAGMTDALAHWRNIALDPEFWIAIGKSQKWPEKYYIGQGSHFAMLVLNKANTDEYWEDAVPEPIAPAPVAKKVAAPKKKKATKKKRV